MMTQETESAEPVNIRSYFLRMGPPIVLLSFAEALTAIVLTDLIIYRTCLTSMKINATKCLMLRTDVGSPEVVNLETNVEPYASLMLMVRSLIESILPAILSLFLGPWSDRGGRRPLLLAAFSGFTIMYFLLCVMCDWNISPWYLLFPTILSAGVGGSHIASLATICYISDTKQGKDRAVQLNLLDASSASGFLLGAVMRPVIYETYGYVTVFLTAAVCCTSALAYVYFLISETVIKNDSNESARGMFKIPLIKKLITGSSGKRDSFNRPVVWLVVFLLALSEMTIREQYNIEFLFSRARLGWNLSQYSYYSTVGWLLRITGLCGISLLTPFLGVSDTTLAGITAVSGLGGAIAKSLTWQSWHMYVSSSVDVLGGAFGPTLRSILSRSVPAEDVGKVFSLAAFVDALSPLAGAPLFTQIYSHFLPPIYPSPVYLFLTSMYVSFIFFIVCVHVLLRKSCKSSSYVLASRDENIERS